MKAKWVVLAAGLAAVAFCAGFLVQGLRSPAPDDSPRAEAPTSSTLRTPAEKAERASVAGPSAESEDEQASAGEARLEQVERDLRALQVEKTRLEQENQRLGERVAQLEAAQQRASDPLSGLSPEERARLERAREWLVSVRGKNVPPLKKLVEVERLGLARSEIPDGDEIGEHLASFPKLRSINFAGSSLTSRHLRALPKRATSLLTHGLDIRDGAGVESILHLADSLKAILLPTPWGKPDQLQILADNFTKLEHLSCLHAANVTDEGLRHIARLPSLRELRIANCKSITGAGLEVLVGLPLRWLDVNGCRFTDQDLETIARLPKLENLEAHGVPLEGPGLAHLARLGRLKSLHLSRTQVDGCAEALAGLEALEFLDVRNTPLSRNQAELAILTSLRPELRLVFKK